MHQQQFESPQSFSPSLQGHSNITETKVDGPGSAETHGHANQENLSVVNEQIKSTSAEADSLTSISRDESKIVEEEQWRESQGWKMPPSDKFDGGAGGLTSNTGSIENESSESSMKQQSQGWNLPPPQNQANNAWRIGGSAQPGTPEHATIDVNEPMLQSRYPDQYRRMDEGIPTPSQSQQNQQLPEQPSFSRESSITSSIAPPHLHRPPDRDTTQPVQSSAVDSTAPSIDEASPRVNVHGHGMNEPQGPPYQANQRDAPRYVQQPPSTAFLRPPPAQGNPYQYAQQRQGLIGQQSYPQHQGSNNYGQQSPQQDGGQYRQYGGRPMMNQYPPPNQVNPQQGYGSQATGQGAQLITQEQQNLVKDSLGRTWQSILGLKDKTKEVVETATNTVAQSAREATQTIAEKGTGQFSANEKAYFS